MEITECGSHLCDLLDSEETVHNQRKKTVNFLDTVLLSSTIPERQVRTYKEISMCRNAQYDFPVSSFKNTPFLVYRKERS